MSHFAAVLDANVLYSYPLTSVLLELAEARLYRPIWSKDIHEEWIRAVTCSRPDVAPKSWSAAVLPWIEPYQLPVFAATTASSPPSSFPTSMIGSWAPPPSAPSRKTTTQTTKRIFRQRC